MGMTTLYKEDMSSAGWAYIIGDLGLPDDTDEICIKHISHITESQRKEKKKMQYNTCETCKASNGRAGLLISDGDSPMECVNCNTTRKTGEVFLDSSLSRTTEEVLKTMNILEQ